MLPPSRPWPHLALEPRLICRRGLEFLHTKQGASPSPMGRAYDAGTSPRPRVQTLVRGPAPAFPPYAGAFVSVAASFLPSLEAISVRLTQAIAAKMTGDYG